MVTRGGRVDEALKIVREAGADPIAVSVIVDRSSGNADFGLPFLSLAALSFPTYKAENLPVELASIPVTSRAAESAFPLFFFRVSSFLFSASSEDAVASVSVVAAGVDSAVNIGNGFSKEGYIDNPLPSARSLLSSAACSLDPTIAKGSLVSLTIFTS